MDITSNGVLELRNAPLLRTRTVTAGGATVNATVEARVQALTPG